MWAICYCTKPLQNSSWIWKGAITWQQQTLHSEKENQAILPTVWSGKFYLPAYIRRQVQTLPIIGTNQGLEDSLEKTNSNAMLMLANIPSGEWKGSGSDTHENEVSWALFCLLVENMAAHQTVSASSLSGDNIQGHRFKGEILQHSQWMHFVFS